MNQSELEEKRMPTRPRDIEDTKAGWLQLDVKQQVVFFIG